MRQLEAMLAAEAEKNYQRQREEILVMLEADTAELARMEDAVLILVDKQKKIRGIQRQRRILYTIPEEDERDEEEELRWLVERTDRLLAALRANGQDIDRLRTELNLTEKTTELAPSLMKALQSLEKELQERAVNLREIHEETEQCHDKHAQRLEAGQRKRREEEEERAQLARDEVDLCQLKMETDAVKRRQNKMQLELEGAVSNTPAEEADKANELEALKAQRADLAALEEDIFNTARGIEDWKSFTWPEEVESEMNRYGMVGSLAMPAFPEHLLRNPALQVVMDK
jgi:hypothetical protein